MKRECSCGCKAFSSITMLFLAFFSATVFCQGAWSPPSRRAAVLIGACTGRGDFATANNTIGPLQTHRLFHDQLPANFQNAGDDEAGPGVTAVVSYKTMNTNVVNFVNSIPNNYNVVMIFHHEPEGDDTFELNHAGYATGGAKFVAQFKSQSDLIRSCNRSNVKVVMAAASSKYGNGAANDEYRTGTYLRGLGNYVDYFTCDIYQGDGYPGNQVSWPDHGLQDYPRWLNWTSVVTDPAIVGTVKPLGITEYGVNTEVGNTMRNQRIQADCDYLVAAFTPGGPSAISPYPLQMWAYWWQNIDTNNTKFTDQATIDTWQAIENVTGGGDITPPGQVTNVQADPSEGQVVLTWTKPNDADLAGVRIKFSTVQYVTDPGTSGVYDGLGTSFTHTGRADGVSIYYTLFTYDNSGNFSDPVQISATPGDTTPPGPVTAFTATADPAGNKVNLLWTNPTDADFAGVVVRQKVGSYPTGPADGTSVYSGTGTSASMTGLTNGTTYYYRAYAKDEVPNYSSAAQDTCVPADTTIPGPVTAFIATADPAGKKVNLSWTNPTDADFAGVEVRQKAGSYPTGPADGTSIYSGTGTSASVTGLTNGTTYYYCAYAKDQSLNYSAAAQQTCVPADTTPPAQVTNVVATPNDGQVALSWTNPGDADFAGVRIKFSTVEYVADQGTSGLYDGTGTSYTHTGRTNGVLIYYTLFTQDNSGNWSAPVQISATPQDTTPPGPVTAFTATADPLGSKVNLSWTNPVDADFQGVVVRQKTGSYPTGPTDGTSVYSGTGTSASVTGLTNGTTYFYCAYAKDEVPNYSSAAQKTCVPADTTPPAQVTGVQAVPGNAQVALSWTNPGDADFAGVRIKFSTVEYVMDPGTSGLYDGTGTSYTHTGRTNGVLIYYTIYTKDTTGNWSVPVQISATPYVDTQVTFKSIAADDGWLLESAQGSGVGGTFSATTTGNQGLRLGDAAAKKQYRALLSFNTASLPDNCTITNVTVSMKRGTVVGTNPFSNMGTCWVDVKNGSFGGAQALAVGDFQAAATHTHVATMSNPTTDGAWSSGTLNSTGIGDINKTGITQFRMNMNLATDGDAADDILGLLPGEAASADQPQLVVTYH